MLVGQRIGRVIASSMLVYKMRDTPAVVAASMTLV